MSALLVPYYEILESYWDLSDKDKAMCNHRTSPPYLYQSPAGSFVSSSSKKSVAAVIFHTYDSSLSQLIKPTTTVLFTECTVINMGDRNYSEQGW